MRKFYEKNELWFAIAWIVLYCAVSIPIRGSLGDESPAMLAGLALIAAGLLAFLKTAHLEAEYGRIDMEERDYRFDQETKERISHIMLEEKKLPELPFAVEKVSYLDGSKVYFSNGGWVIARFSGTEPLLRIFCEMPKPKDAVNICEIYERFLGLSR